MPLGPAGRQCKGEPEPEEEEEEEEEQREEEEEEEEKESTWPRVEAAAGFSGELLQTRELRAARDANGSSSSGACSGGGSSSISETARELCRAVSVSLGLVSAEGHEAHHAPQVPLASATDYLFEAHVQSSCAREGRRDDHQHHIHIQHDHRREMFKVGEEEEEESAGREHPLFSLTSLESKSSVASPSANACRFEPQMQLEPLCHREDPFSVGDSYGAAPPYGVRVKREVLEPWARTPYAQNYPAAVYPSYGSAPAQQYGESAGPPRADPYEREPWYRAPFTHTPTVKSHVGEWLDVSTLADAR